MGSQTEEEKPESIERWVESVTEETSPTTHNRATDVKESQREMARGGKRAGSTSGSAPATTSKRAKSVQFSEKGETSHSSRSHATTLSARALRSRLLIADPPVSFTTVESRKKADAVTDLFSKLIDALEDAVPATLRDRAKTLENGGTVTVRGMSEDDTQIWKIVRETLKTASKALDIASDKSEWTNVVSPLLQQTMRANDQEGGLLEVMHIQNVSIGPPSLIPTVGDEPLVFKNVDLAIVFSCSEPDLGRLCTKVRKKNGALELSQSEDATLSRFCQFAAIEIKSPDGSYYEASVQLGIWLAAGLEKSRELRELAATKNGDTATQTQGESQEEYLLPYVGISVHGHVWNLHLAWKGLNGAVVSDLHLIFLLEVQPAAYSS